MGPILSALASSVGKGILADTVGLLNGKDKNKIDEETTDTNVEAIEPSLEDSDNTIEAESHSAKDDDINIEDLSVPDSELEAMTQDTNAEDKDASDTELAALLPDIEDEETTPYVNDTVNDEFFIY